MQKIGLVGSLASILGLWLTFHTADEPNGQQVNYGSGGQAIGNVEGDVKFLS
jgi:hypothetical protein